MKQFEQLERFCKNNDITVSEEAENKLALFYELLTEKNRTMNLTAITEPSEVEIKHYIDSLEAVPVIKELFNDEKSLKLLDMGTGAGFPGVPLAVFMKDTELVLADSLRKRIVFLQEVKSALNLSNINLVHGRAEELGRGEMRESFDICVSRAVAQMPVLAEYCIPFIKVGGYGIFYKSGNIEQELSAAQTAFEALGATLADVKRFVLPETDIERSLIIVRKDKKTPEKYPRKAGKPAKSPLK